MTYQIGLEDFRDTLKDIFPLYCEHYAEMKTRLEGEGTSVSPFKMNFNAYANAAAIGQLLHFVARTPEGEPIGYSNIYLTTDAHNGDLIAREDTIFITRAHRNGIGRKLTKFILEVLKSKGCKRGYVVAATDPRIVHLWTRLGFQTVGTAMVINFEQV